MHVATCLFCHCDLPQSRHSGCYGDTNAHGPSPLPTSGLHHTLIVTGTNFVNALHQWGCLTLVLSCVVIQKP